MNCWLRFSVFMSLKRVGSFKSHNYVAIQESLWLENSKSHFHLLIRVPLLIEVQSHYYDICHEFDK